MPAEGQIWIVDDDSSIRWVMEKALTRAGLSCRAFDSGDAVVDALDSDTPMVVVSDIRMPGMDGITLLSQIKARQPELPVIITTAHSDLDSAVNAYEEGAFEYLPKPFDIDEMVATVTRAQSQQAQNADGAEDAGGQRTTEIIGNAPAMQEVFRAIGRLAQSHITVLINGESGTGKELVARALHRHSPRADSVFVALNMAAIPQELMESELFGHEKGAFTGANNRREGRFEQARGGTLFLDEIGDMPAAAQTRLLRVLQDGEFFRVGGIDSIKTDVRIIAATHQKLESLVESGAFREDLFHRLNVIRIHVPKLSERREDIPQLLNHFLAAAGRELRVETKVLSADALSLLTHLPWPGNVRQLENTCRWLTVMAAGREIVLSDLPPELSQQKKFDAVSQSETWHEQLAGWANRQLSDGKSNVLRQALPLFESIMIQAALRHTGGRKAEAAELLGWGRNTLTRKLKDLDLPAA